MHLADGFLQAPVIVGTTVVGAVAVTLAARTTPRRELTSPMVGAAAAFVLAAQMVNFPVASSVSGHLIGGVLVAILLGYRTSVLVMTAVLSMQAIVFQDGGVTVLGTNILNLAVAGPGAGYLVYRAVSGFFEPDSPWTRRRAAAAFLGGWISAVTAAFLAAVELWLSGQAALGPALRLLLGIHAVIGIAEGGATLLIARFLSHHQPSSCDFFHRAPGRNSS